MGLRFRISLAVAALLVGILAASGLAHPVARAATSTAGDQFTPAAPLQSGTNAVTWHGSPDRLASAPEVVTAIEQVTPGLLVNALYEQAGDGWVTYVPAAEDQSTFQAVPAEASLLVDLVPAPATPRVMSAVATPSASNALMVDLAVTTDVPATLVVEYGNSAAGTFRITASSPGGMQHVTVMRLRPDSDYDYRVTAVTADGTRSAAAFGTFHTGSLPAFMQSWHWQGTGQPTSDLTLLDVKTFDGSGNTGYIMLDRDGAIVWYFLVPPDQGGTANAVRRLPNGNFAAITLGSLLEFTPDGRILHNVRDDLGVALTHHDLLPLPDGQLLTIADLSTTMDLSAYGLAHVTPVGNPALRIINLEADQVGPVLWKALDMIPIAEHNNGWFHPWVVQVAGQFSNNMDWLHLNAVAFGPRGNLLVSSPAVDTIYSLSPDLSHIEWRLGGNYSDFKFDNECDRFFFQHSPTEVSENHILMFDNGGAPELPYGRPPGCTNHGYSRAVEFELDFQTMTAHKVWEYRTSPDLWNPIQGDAIRLPNGNTFIGFSSTPINIVEVDPAGNRLFTLTEASGKAQAMYRATPQTQISSEVRISTR